MTTDGGGTVRMCGGNFGVLLGFIDSGVRNLIENRRILWYNIWDI